MRLSDIISSDRILVDPEGSVVKDKAGALRLLAELTAPAVAAEPAAVEQLLVERERLLSTGIGDGVAVPHASLDTAPAHAATVLVCPRGIEFDAIDGGRVSIIVGVVGPKRQTGEHLKILARISRVLRDAAARSALARCEDASAAYQILMQQDAALP